MSDNVVFLHGNKTVGSMVFADIVPSHNWFIDPGMPVNSTLTLDLLFGSEPIIDVVNQIATLQVVVAGNEGLTKIGAGKLLLARPNTYTGRTTIRCGTLALDFSAAGVNSNLIAPGSELLLGGRGVAASGGTLELIGATAANNSQTFAGTTLDFGQSAIRVDQNGAANVDLSLGLFDRDLGGILNFSLPTKGNIRAESITIPNMNGILGAWATVGTGASLSWATNDGTGNIVPYSAFSEMTGAPVISNQPAANVRWSGSTGDATLAPGTTDINTLLFADAARRTLAIPAGSTLRLGKSGGIFKSDTSAGEATSQLTIGAPGTFVTAGGGPNLVGELILNANANAPDQNGIVVNSTITNNAAAPVTLIKSGNAVALLTATNTYTEGTYIAGGRLRTNAAGAFGTGPVSVAMGAQAYVDSGTHSNNFAISGNGFIEASDELSGGALRLGNGTHVSGMVTLLGNSRISAGGATGEAATISGQITGPFPVEFSSGNNGILTLTNSRNDWWGDTRIGPGILRIGGSGEVIPNIGRGGVIMYGDPLSTYPAVLDLNGRTETIEKLSSTGDTSKIVITNNASSDATLRLESNRDRTFGGVIHDGVGKIGLTIVRGEIQTLSGVNTYTGPTIIQGGTLRLGSSSSLPVGTNLMLMGGSLDLAGFNATVSGLSGGIYIENRNNLRPSVLTFAGGTTTFSGAIVNATGLTVASGTLALTGVFNTYTGPTTLNGGTLSVTGKVNDIGTVTINSGATLSGAGNGSSTGRVGNVTMQAGSNLRPGATAADGSVGTLTMSSLTVNGGDLRFDLATGGTSDRVNVIGIATFTAPSTITPVTVTPGVYTLLTADTLRGVPPTLNVPPATRATFALNFETLADQIRLIISGTPPKALTWTGANGSEWDLNTTANWIDGAVAEKYFNLDSVTFADGPPNRNVVLNTTVFPTLVAVNNSAGNDYTITGTGGIGDSGFTSTSLSKSGAGSLTLGGNNTYAGTTTINEGLLRLTGSIVSNNMVTVGSAAIFAVEDAASVSSVTGTGMTTVGNGTNEAMLTANHIRQASLTIGAGSTVRTTSNGGASVLGALSIADGGMPTATFDLGNNSAIVNYTGASPVATIRAQIISGRGGPGLGANWTGMGITSSAAAAAEPESRSVGYAENSSLPLGPYTNFRGQPVDDTSVLMAFTRTGDANLDGVVNDDDVTIVGATYAAGVPQPHWALGDFDYNGFVDDDDVTLLGVFYDPSAAPVVAVPASAGAVVAIPEPGAVVLAGIALACLAIAAVVNRRPGCSW